MKYFMILLPLLMIACGESKTDPVTGENLKQTCEANAAIVGDWIDGSLNKLVLRPDCTGETVDACDHEFTYYKPVNNKMLVNLLFVNTVNGCLPKGESTCSFVYENSPGTGETITLNCGQGMVIYTKQ